MRCGTVTQFHSKSKLEDWRSKKQWMVGECVSVSLHCTCPGSPPCLLRETGVMTMHSDDKGTWPERSAYSRYTVDTNYEHNSVSRISTRHNWKRGHRMQFQCNIWGSEVVLYIADGSQCCCLARHHQHIHETLPVWLVVETVTRTLHSRHTWVLPHTKPDRLAAADRHTIYRLGLDVFLSHYKRVKWRPRLSPLNPWPSFSITDKMNLQAPHQLFQQRSSGNLPSQPALSFSFKNCLSKLPTLLPWGQVTPHRLLPPSHS